MEELKIKAGTFLVGVSTGVRGVRTKRSEESPEIHGDTVIKRTHATTVIANASFYDRAQKLKRRAVGIVEEIPRTVLGRLTDAETKERLREEFAALRVEVDAFNAEPGNPHRLYVEFVSMPVSPDLDPETVRGVYREIEQKLVDLRAIVLAHDEVALRNWKRNNANITSFLPDLTARVVNDAIACALTVRKAIKARVKAGETVESAARAEEAGLATLDASLGWLAGCLADTAADTSAILSTGTD
jgi:hypothetical protein